MCGILGVTFKQNTAKSLDFVLRLMKELKIRGHHCYGIGWYDGIYYESYRSTKIEDVVQMLVNKNPSTFIFHNRYSTSGDWQVMENNMPIFVERIGAIAMNGVLSMNTKENNENIYNVKLDTENDAEIFLRLMERGEDLLDILKKYPQCSFAGLLLHIKGIVGLRNNKRPLYYYEDDDIKVLISTYDTIIRAGGKKENIRMVKPFEVVSI